MTTIGPHLLGRKPSPPDERDWKLSLFLNEDPVAAAILELQQTTVGYKNKYWEVPPNGTHWRKGLALLGWTPPTPVPTDVSKTWANTENVLDQGDTGHCVGFSGAQWGNTLPIDDQWKNEDGHNLYYECKVIDGEPGAEDGSYVRSLAKVLQDRKRLTQYAWAASTDEITQWIQTKGPVVVGTDWYNNMFDPDQNGFLDPSGGIAGGHAYILLGYDATKQAYQMLNSWGSSWGDNGRAWITITNFDKLLKADGEACAAIELNL